MSMNPSALTSMGNAPVSSGNPSQLYSSISSQGLSGDPSQEAQEEASAPTNPAETAIQRFGKVFDQFDTLTKMPEYSSATKEAEEVRTAMKNWLEAVVAATSKTRGESPNSY